uniref:Uncharacterized protein n=1 Tax=Tetradesmus obliquus TaxID=3088 RepID=A0A383W3J3_TETOB|eukprot:jgi/Sobl393_1/19635/SZX72041.1
MAGTGWAGGNNPSDMGLVAYCPAAACPAQAPSSTCRQINHDETLTMKQGPCFGSATVLVGSTPAELVRGDTFVYTNTDSKQTSMCKTGAASDPPGRTLCWVQGSFKGVMGWLPVGRGTFKDAFCSAEPQAAQSFVTESCVPYDVVVYGSGLGGIAAALTARATLESQITPKGSRLPRVLLIATDSKLGGLATVGGQKLL